MQARSCPISGIRTDATVARIVAAQVAVMTGVATVGQSAVLAAIISLDFAVRAFGYGQLSIFRSVAKGIKSSLKLKSRMTDEAPKVFAARTGFLLVVLLAVSQLSGCIFAAFAIGILVVLFALLEALAGICVGCMLYNVFSSRRNG